MGTNYYARPIKTIKQIKETRERVESEIRGFTSQSSIELDDLLEEWEQMKIAQCDSIHIGKSSAGWKFLFNHNDWQYFTNIQEMKDWLKEQEIESEYGEVMSFEEFWKMVEQKQKVQSRITGKNWYVFKEGYEFSSSTEFC